MALSNSYLTDPYYPASSTHVPSYLFSPQNLQCAPTDPSSSFFCNPRPRLSIQHYPLHSYYPSSVMLPQYPPSYNNLNSLSSDRSYSYPAIERFRRTCENDPVSSSGSSIGALHDRVSNVGLVTNYDQLPSSFPPLLAFTARSSPSSSLGFPSALASNTDGFVLNTKQQSHDQHKTRRSLTKHELQAMDPDPKYCDNCRTTTTPSWRRCPLGRILLCNACGL